MRKILLFLFLSLVITSCKPTKEILPKIEYREIYKETVRDSIITLPADSSYIQALLECDSIGNVYLKQLLNYGFGNNKLNPPKLNINDNILSATAKVDSISIYLILKDRYSYIDKQETEIIEIEKPLNKWQKFLQKCGVAFLITVFLSIIYFVLKFHAKILNIRK